MAKLKIVERVKTWAKMKKELRKANKLACEIGVFSDGDSFLSMLAQVHEYGATIEAKGQYLTIPTPAAGGRSARDFGPELFKPKGKDVLAVARGGGQIEVMFILKKSVEIPERSFIRETFDKKNREWSAFLDRQMDGIIEGRLTADQALERLGQRMVADVQETLTKLRTPANAPITIANKGSSNPLIDTGRLRQSITYKVVRR
jgi:hypothetical protein